MATFTQLLFKNLRHAFIWLRVFLTQFFPGFERPLLPLSLSALLPAVLLKSRASSGLFWIFIAVYFALLLLRGVRGGLLFFLIPSLFFLNAFRVANQLPPRDLAERYLQRPLLLEVDVGQVLWESEKSGKICVKAKIREAQPLPCDSSAAPEGLVKPQREANSSSLLPPPGRSSERSPEEKVYWGRNKSQKPLSESDLNSLRGLSIALVLPEEKRGSPEEDIAAGKDISGGKTAFARLKLRVCLSQGDKAANPGGFDERRWLAGQGIFLKAELLKAADSEVLAQNKVNFLSCCRRRFLKRASEGFCSAFTFTAKEGILKEAAGFCEALLFGSKTELSRAFKMQMQLLGLSHLIAVSGMHLLFLLRPLQRLACKMSCPPRLLFGLELVLILIWNWLCGVPAGLVRASLMFLVREGSRRFGLHRDLLSELSLAALLMALMDPFVLRNQGFIWSFAATAALFLFAEPLAQKLPHILPRLDSQAIHALAAVLSVQFALLLIQASEKSSFSPLLLFLQLPFTFLVSLILPLAGVASWLFIFPFPLRGILAYALHFLGEGLFLAASSLLKTGIFITSQRALKIQLDPFLTGLLIFLYLLMQPRLMRNFRSREGSVRRLCLLLSLLVLFFQPFKSLFAKPCFTVLSVGQGDGMVLQDGPLAFLFDGGKPEQLEKSILPFMEKRGITTFDFAFASHADLDHIGVLPELIRLGRVRGLLISEDWQLEKPAGRELLELARLQNMPIRRLKGGDELILDEQPRIRLCVDFASRLPSGTGKEENERSLVATLKLGEQSFLLSGDMTAAKEEIFMREDLKGRKGATILKVAHHGSRFSTSERFLRALKPRLALISVGANRYGHPSEEVLRRLKAQKIPSLRTDEEGALDFQLEREGSLTLKCFKSGRRFRLPVLP